MKLQIALVMFGCCSLASAEIYHYVDPVTGHEEYTNQPKCGSVRIPDGEISYKVDPALCEAKRAELRETRSKRAVVVAEMVRRHPTACTGGTAYYRKCFASVGMSVKLDGNALELRRDGYIDDEQGKRDRWKGNGCTVFSKGDRITAVTCRQSEIKGRVRFKASHSTNAFRRRLSRNRLAQRSWFVNRYFD